MMTCHDASSLRGRSIDRHIGIARRAHRAENAEFALSLAARFRLAEETDIQTTGAGRGYRSAPPLSQSPSVARHGPRRSRQLTKFYQRKPLLLAEKVVVVASDGGRWPA